MMNCLSLPSAVNFRFLCYWSETDHNSLSSKKWPTHKSLSFSIDRVLAYLTPSLLRMVITKNLRPKSARDMVIQNNSLDAITEKQRIQYFLGIIASNFRIFAEK